MTLETDGDPAHYLPRNSSIVNKFRNDKGDLEGTVETRTVDGKTVKVVTHAKVRDFSICQDLIRRGFLEEHHRAYGYSLLEMQHAFSGPVRHKLNAVFLDQLMGMPVTTAQAGRVYDEVTKEITFQRVKIIIRACNDSAAEDHASKVIMGINVYQDCFNRLVSALDAARKRLHDERENALANDPLFR